MRSTLKTNKPGGCVDTTANDRCPSKADSLTIMEEHPGIFPLPFPPPFLFMWFQTTSLTRSLPFTPNKSCHAILSTGLFVRPLKNRRLRWTSCSCTNRSLLSEFFVDLNMFNLNKGTTWIYYKQRQMKLHLPFVSKAHPRRDLFL